MKRVVFIYALACLSALSLKGQTNVTNVMKSNLPSVVTGWDKTFAKSDKVEHDKVTFTNRFGITLTADVYKPKGAHNQLAALAVSGPFGAVKEQASGLYAQTLAEAGFLTIAFDPSFTGESGGEPCYSSSMDINTEDFCAAVPVTLYNLTRVTQQGYFDTMTEDDRYALKQRLAAQRTEEFRSGRIEPQGGLPAKTADDAPDYFKQYVDYYKNTARGYHPRSLNSNMGWNITTPLMRLNQRLWIAADEVRSPVLIVHGEKAHSRYFGEEAFCKLTSGRYAGNKELLIVPGATHCDLYDGGLNNFIPWERIISFFKAHLQ